MKKHYSVISSVIFLLNASLGFSQDDAESESDSGGGQSAAESAVTGSASAPAASAPGTVESNPVVNAFRDGVTFDQIKSLGDISNLKKAYSSGGIKGIANTIQLVAKGFSVNDAIGAVASDKASTLLNLDGSVDSQLASLLSAFNADVMAAALGVGGLPSYTSSYQTAVVDAATIANSLLQDVYITSSLPSTTVSLSSFSSNGYNIAFANLLANYGAIGSNGGTLAAAIFPTSDSGANLGTSLTALSSTSSYLSYLETFTGKATFGDVDITSSVLDIPISNITINPGSNISIGQSGTSSTVDVSSVLTEASADHRNYRKAHVIGAAKDMVISGSTTFTNVNDAEDHALVLGAADDFMLSGSDLTYTGSNLGLGAGGSDADSMYLVNTNITTGGNLALGTLGTLNISSANLNVGNANSSTSDPDNVYLYANDLIQVNGLSFTGSRLDDVYMEAITVNLKDVAFPSTADVILKSRDGTKHFGTYSTPVVGGVNLTNVSHGGTVLTDSHFDGVAGHHDSSIRLPNGTAAIKIRKQY